MIETDEYMSKPVVSVESKATVEELAKIMDEKNIGSLVVIDENIIKGILTERDIVRKVDAKGKDAKKTKAADIMTKEVITVSRDASLMEVAALMKQHSMRRIVVTEDGKAVGIITSRDLIDLLV